MERTLYNAVRCHFLVFPSYPVSFSFKDFLSPQLHCEGFITATVTLAFVSRNYN